MKENLRLESLQPWRGGSAGAPPFIYLIIFFYGPAWPGSCAASETSSEIPHPGGDS